MQFYYFLDSKITTESLCSNNDSLLFSGNFKVCYIEVSCFLIEFICFFSSKHYLHMISHIWKGCKIKLHNVLKFLLS